MMSPLTTSTKTPHGPARSGHTPVRRDRRRAALEASRLEFQLPEALEASSPAEARGLARDEVGLLVTRGAQGTASHDRFTGLASHLSPGDLVVINTSATLKASLPARRGQETLRLHLSTQLPAGLWVVELRRVVGEGHLPCLDARPGEVLSLPEGGRVHLLTPHRQELRARPGQVRLWLASLEVPGGWEGFTQRHGQPIRYHYAQTPWPIEDYQTVFADTPGSAEMPSAGRPFTARALEALAARGVGVAPLVLHTGVASLEDDEPPYEERFHLPATTANAVNDARARGGRIVAVGTTVVRALETVADAQGKVHAGSGWTDLVITPERGVGVVGGLLTGFHEPRSTHLAMLQAIAGRPHVERAYAQALERGYLWHEFGDSHLILP